MTKKEAEKFLNDIEDTFGAVGPITLKGKVIEKTVYVVELTNDAGVTAVVENRRDFDMAVMRTYIEIAHDLFMDEQKEDSECLIKN